MKTQLLNMKLSAALAGALLVAPAFAADPVKAGASGAMGVTASPGLASIASDRARLKPYNDEKAQLKAGLKVGEAKASYAKALTDMGYLITSINKDKDDYVEYEVVKGTHSYEVQIDIDKASGKAKKIDVDRNVWRADATKAALRGTKTEAATKVVAGADAYSDRDRMKTWSNEKEKLEKSLPLGRDKAFYLGELKKQGYQVTSTNDSEKDYMEVEVVKGRDSYEVQIDFEGGKAKKVDVTTDMWQTEATEKALAGPKR